MGPTAPSLTRAWRLSVVTSHRLYTHTHTHTRSPCYTEYVFSIPRATYSANREIVRLLWKRKFLFLPLVGMSNQIHSSTYWVRYGRKRYLSMTSIWPPALPRTAEPQDRGKKWSRNISKYTTKVGDRGSTVVKALCHKSEGHWFDPS